MLCLRRRGRHVQVGLLPPAQGRPLVPMERVVALELEVLGSHGMAAHAFPALLELVAAGRLRPDLLVTREVGARRGGGGARRGRSGARHHGGHLVLTVGVVPCGVRQRVLETVDRRLASSDLPGATPGATGTSGHRTARDRLRSAAGHRAHDGTGRDALPHAAR